MAGHELPPKPAGLVIGKERARGSYGTVHSGELDGKPVVIKKLHHILLQAPNNDKLLSDFYRECRILSTVRHANVVRFIGAYWDQEAKEQLLVMEAAKENLKQHLERNKAHLGAEKQLSICSSMTEGLNFLHGRAEPIIHRDLKPENVLVWEDGAVKIGDFGQSKLLDHPGSYMKSTQPGTIAYMPPEALKKKPRYTSKVDVFSLGAVMLEVCTQSPPTVWLEGIGTVPEVERRKDDLALLGDTHPVKPLIIWCLQDNHESRPDVRSANDQVKLLEGGVKEPDYQQRIHQLEGALRESEEREVGFKGRLEEAEVELRHTKAEVADLQQRLEKGQKDLRESSGREVGLKVAMRKGEQALRESEKREMGLQGKLEEAEVELMDTKAEVADLRKMVAKGRQDLRETRMQYEVDQERLMIANHTTREELKAVHNQLDIARKDKESLEAEVTCLRQTLDAWKATAEDDSNGKGFVDQASTDTRSSTDVVLEGPMCELPGCTEQPEVKSKKDNEFCSNGHHEMCDMRTLSPVSLKPSTSQRSPTSPTVSHQQHTSPTPFAPHSTDKGAVSHTTAPSGGDSTWESHSSQPHHHTSSWGIDARGIYRGRCTHPGCSCTGFQRTFGARNCVVCHHPPTSHPVSHSSQPHHHQSSWGIVGGLSGWKVCHGCATGYSPIDLGACPKCCPREECKRSGCGKPAFYSLELGSFGYCGAECHDRCELEGARREVARALKEFEVNSGGVSSQATAKESINHTALAQPLTRSMPQRNDTPTAVGATPEAPPTQQSLPPSSQGQVSFSVCNCKLSRDVVRAMSLYDRGKLQTVKGTSGLLLTSIEVNRETLASGVQPLDLITQFDGKQAESLCDTFGCYSLYVKMTRTIADVWIAWMSLLPSMSDLQSLVEPHQSMRKCRIVGFLVTQKDLVDPASFLGVHMCEYSTRQVDQVRVLSEGYKAGLRENDIIQSVTFVTADGGVHGPDTEWSFDRISRTAKNSPSVFALLMTVLTF